MGRLPRATLEQKIEILDYFHGLKRPQADTVEHYRDKVLISTSLFSEWLKQEAQLRDQFANLTVYMKKCRRKIRFKYEKINNAMDEVVRKRLVLGEPINEPMLREYWALFARQFGVDDPKRLKEYSHGWLNQFKKRHGLNRKVMSGRKLKKEDEGDELGVVPTGGNENQEYEYTMDSPPRQLVQLLPPPSHHQTTPVAVATQLQPPQQQSQPQQQPQQLQSSQQQPQPPMINNQTELAPQPASQASQFRPQQGLNFGNNLLFSSPYQRHDTTRPTEQPLSPRLAQMELQLQLRSYEKHNELLTQPALTLTVLSYTRPQIQTSNLQYLATSTAPARTGRPPLPPPNLFDVVTSGPVDGSGSVNGSGDAGMNSSDIERFIYMFADRFFQDHQYEYPQTLKIFQEFKTLFYNERVISLRSKFQKKQAAPQAAPHHQPRQPLVSTGLGAPPLLQYQQLHQNGQMMPLFDEYYLRAGRGLATTTSPSSSQFHKPPPLDRGRPPSVQKWKS